MIRTYFFKMLTGVTSLVPGVAFVLLNLGSLSCTAEAATFLQFGQDQNETAVYKFINDGNGTGTFSSLYDAKGVPVSISLYQAAIPVYARKQALPTVTTATLYRSSVTNTAATVNGSGFSQEIGVGYIRFVLADKSVLFEIDNASNTILGSIGGSTGNFGASSSLTNFSYYSDYIDFSYATSIDRSVTMNDITPNLSVGTDGILNSFTASATGTFAAKFSSVQTPEPGSLFLGMTLLGVAAVRRSSFRTR